ncbi:MAG: GAF domain-containing protein [Chloroflexi bacterium]|nr:GAF domain-containing protein [Chloroflexota bacterium]MCC6896246.1 GAF domain-containing protein [Anaerolineae bacterium]
MTTNPTPAAAPVSDAELSAIRQNVSQIRSQITGGRVDGQFLLKQVETLHDLLGRIAEERKQRKKEGRFQALYNVSRLLGESLDLQTVLNQVMDAIIHLTGADRGFLMLRNDDGGMTVQVARNLDQKTLGSDDFKFSHTITNQVLDSGRPIVTNNAVEDPRFSGQASIIGQALRSIMATPLRARGTVIGVVYVDNRMTTGLFMDDDLAALDAFAGQAAIAIDNARLFSATDQALSARVEELQTLRRVDHQLNETLDADKAMQITLEWACRLSDATSGHLGLLESDRVKAVHHYGDEDGVQPDYLDGTYPHLMDVVSTNKPITVSGEQTGRDYSITMVPIARENTVFGVVVIKRKGAEAFTPEEQDLIERMVVRAAVAIENARLYAAVQAANLAKSEFVGIVAHDLKVPMTSISGYTDLAIMVGELSDRQKEFLQKVKDTVKRMAVLVSDLADISRMESGHFYMNETRVPVSDIVQAVRDATMTQMQEYQHEYIEDIQVSLPDMQVDYYRLLQVLTNLVSNAYKYTPNGGKITFRVTQNANKDIEFSITDTGIGLSPEAIAKLGTKFWRAEDDFTRSRPGTGLGFAITRSLVEQMGDGIHIESEVGKGSTFSFGIPVAG